MSDKDGLLIAVDGGGSGCRARIVSARGQTIGQAQGGPANLRSNFQGACESVCDVVTSAFKAGHLRPEQQSEAVAWIGLAGAGEPDEAKAAAQHIRSTLGLAHVKVSSDRETTVEGALGQDDGVLALLGTGAFFAVQRGGTRHFVGGWGFLLGDECGGAWLGQQLLRQVAQAIDGMVRHSPLTHRTASYFNDDREHLIAFVRSATPADFGAFAPQLVEAAQQGDPVAAAIMERATGALVATLDKLQTRTAKALCLAGGLAPVYAARLPNVYRKILRPAKGTALDGAVALARSLAASKSAGS